MRSTVAPVMIVASMSTFVAPHLSVTIISAPVATILALLLAVTLSLSLELAETARTHDGEGSPLIQLFPACIAPALGSVRA